MDETNFNSSCDAFKVKLATWNCNGLKSSMDYALQLVNTHHVTFFCEHWLQSHEIDCVKTVFRKDGKTAYLKSSVDPLTPLKGRPYGGIGFVCDESTGLSFMFEESDSDRIISVKVYKGEKIVLTVLGVYLPYDSHSRECTENYLDTIDKLQCVLEQSDSAAPAVIVGDMNTSLPNMETIRPFWYKQRPFSQRSLLLYDFLEENELCVANFCTKQEINYTYRKNEAKSYIDHVFIPTYLLNAVTKCQIVLECADNISDHLPLSTWINVTLKTTHNSEDHDCWVPAPTFPIGKWSNPTFRDLYTKEIKEVLDSWSPVDLCDISEDSALTVINDLCNSLCNALHGCVEKCLLTCTQKRSHNGKQWWTADCGIAKKRNRLFHFIWKESGSPKTGTVYDSYKAAKKNYRNVCRKAVQNQSKMKFKLIESLHSAKKSSHMWNIIRKTRTNEVCSDAITIPALEIYFREKFAQSSVKSDEICLSEQNSKDKYYNLCATNPHHNFSMSVQSVKRYIKQVNSNIAPGIDGIVSEHLKYALDSKLPVYLSKLFSICFRFGIVPDTFKQGLLIPVLKKSNIDPTVAKNYRPITMSVIFSKVMEYYILDNVSHQFNNYQFGFIPQRSTNMVTALVHDVIAYCNAGGSPVYHCSRDAEGAFDCIPHGVLLDCANGIIPDMCWRVLYYWYHNMYIHIKWNNNLGQRINIKRARRPDLYNFV